MIAGALYATLAVEACVIEILGESGGIATSFEFDTRRSDAIHNAEDAGCRSLTPAERAWLYGDEWIMSPAVEPGQHPEGAGFGRRGQADATFRVGRAHTTAGLLHAWFAHSSAFGDRTPAELDVAKMVLRAGGARLCTLIGRQAHDAGAPVPTPTPVTATAEFRSRRATQAEALLDLSLALGASIETSELVQLATDALRREIHADVTTTYIFDYGRDMATTPYWSGATAQEAELLQHDAVLPSARVPIESKLARTLKPEIVDDLHSAFETLVVGFVQLQLDRGVGHLLAAPVTADGEMIGVTYAWNRVSARRFDAADIEAAEALLNQLAAGLQRAEHYQQERRARQRLELLLDSARAMNRATTVDDVIVGITDTLQRLFPNDETDVVTLGNTPLDHTAMQRTRTGPWNGLVEPIRARFEAGQETVLTVRSNAQLGNQQRMLAGAIRNVDAIDGLLLASSSRPSFGAAGDAHILGLLAAQAAGALGRAGAFADLTDHVADLTLLQHFGQRVTSHATLDEAFTFAGRELRRFAEYTAGGVVLPDAAGENLVVAAGWGASAAVPLGLQVPIQNSVCGAVYSTSVAEYVADVAADARAFASEDFGWTSMICAPLLAGGEVLGVLVLGHDATDHFTARQLPLVSLIAEQLASAIVLIRQHEHSRNLYRAGIEALAAAVDAKDAFTHAHSRRVAELSRRIAVALSLDQEVVDEIELAGLLHDVGKIGIPDHILTKPGRLDPEERLIMMNHAAISARIVAQHGALAPLVPLVHHHHEWFDGRGYPDGLRGDDIPLGAAIIAAADAFETMTSDRVYRSKLDQPAALDEMLRSRGTQFHPTVVDALLAVVDRTSAQPAAPPRPLPSPFEAGAVTPIRASDVAGLRVLARIAEEIGRVTELESFLDHVRSIVRDQLVCDAALIWLIDEDDELVPAGYHRNSLEQELAAQPPVLAAPELPPTVTNVLRPMRGSSLLRYQSLVRPARSAAFVPLVVEDRPIGYLEVTSREPERFRDAEHQLLLAIASQIAPTVRIAQLHDLVKRAADTDGLTGVLNHRAFYRELDAALAGARDADQLYVLIIDVVGLKAVNDTYGHVAGDQTLRSIAEALRARLREPDVLARYGGDEFAAIVADVSADEIEALVAHVEEPVAIQLEDGRSLTIHLRCGHASLNDSERRATELVARADSLLYRVTGPTTRQEARVQPDDPTEIGE